jgi:carbon storage regulator
MLVLSRKKNESIVINNDIVITVVEIRGDKVRLGIEAPKDVPVHRQEVYEAIHGVKAPTAAATAATTAAATTTSAPAPAVGTKADNTAEDRA